MIPRRIKQVATVCAVGAGVAAAVAYAYRWWSASPNESAEASVDCWLQDWDPREEAQKGDIGEGKESELLQREKESLLCHFENVQKIANRIHFPKMLPLLGIALLKSDKVELLREQIKAQGSLHPSQLNESIQERMSLWSQIIEASFVRFVAANWILPMGFLVTKVVLGLMGRSMYMGQTADHIHQGMTPGGKRRNPLPQMFTKECQSRLLSLLDLVPAFIIEIFLPHVQEAVASEVCEINLKDPFALDDLLAILSNINGKVASAIATIPLNLVLGTEKVQTMESMRGNIQLLQPHYWAETDLVDNLLEESRTVLGTPDFRSIYIVSTRTFCQLSAAQISSAFKISTDDKVDKSSGNLVEGRPREQLSASAASSSSSPQSQPTEQVGTGEPVALPFAKCGTLLAKIAKGWLDPAQNGQKSPLEGVASLGVIHDFCLEVYTSNTVPL